MKEKAKLFLLAGMIAGVVGLSSCKEGAEKSSEGGPPTVPVAKVARETLSKEVPIPGEFRPYVEVELHAKVSGYLNQMNVDFGDRVTNGELLATIEVPELQDQLNNAVANEQRAEADYTNAHLIYTRLVSVNQQHPNLVAEQDIDTATAKDLTAQAAVAAAKAEAGRYRTLVGYTRIMAPFDGVITHRYVDPGALVEAGTTSANTEGLLRISDNYRLRLDFPVSDAYVKNVKVGDVVQVRVESMGGKTFNGKITRATLRVNLDTRTMMTEIEVPNPDLELVPGMYASVSFQAERHVDALSIPVQAMPPGQSSTAYVVNNQNEVEERPVKLGLETPYKFEVLSGLKEGDLVLIGSRAAVKPGEKVEAKIVESPTQY